MELLDLARRLKPIVLGWFDEATMGVTPGSHALDPAAGPHTGTLTLTYLDQSGAASGEAPVWDGAAWMPTGVMAAITVARGDLIVGNATPQWAALGVGAGGTFLRSDGTDPSWSAIQVTDLPAHASTHLPGGGDALTTAAPSVNLSVSSTNAEGSAASLARSDHRHAITSSANPGAAAALLASNASGFLQLTGMGIGVAAGAANRITIVNGGSIGQAAGPLLTFDDTNNHLEASGAELHIHGYDLVVFSDAGSSEVIRLNHDEDFSVAPDIAFTASGAIAANDNLYLLIDGDNGGTGAAFVIGKNATTDSFTEIMRVSEAGFLGLNETENAGMDIGISINQGSYDTQILAGMSSDVAHGMTDKAETDTFFFFRKNAGDAGGLGIYGLRDADSSNNGAINLWGYLGEDAMTAKTAAGYGIVNILAEVKSGTGSAAPGADQNLLAICAATTVRFIFDTEGEMHSDAVIGDGNDWDEWDDLALAADLSRLPKARWGDLVRYNVEDFERAGLVTLSVDGEGRQHAFYKHRAMLDFHNCCFADVYRRLQACEMALALLGEGG